MHVVFKTRSQGIKALSTDLTMTLLAEFDFSAPDPGPVSNVENKDNDEEDVQEDAEEDVEEDAENENRNDKDSGSDGEDSEEVRNKSRRKKEKEKNNRKKTNNELSKCGRIYFFNIHSICRDVPRLDAMSVLYNIIYMACIDKAAAIRLHGSHCFAKILESETHRKAFQECCQKMNASMDERFGDIGDRLHETISEGQEAPTRKGKTDLLNEEQQIIEKVSLIVLDKHIHNFQFHKLKMMNKGEARVEQDIVYMIVRRLSTDEKAPVKKSAGTLLKTFLCFCDEQVKFEVGLSVLQKMCRDKMVSVRKSAAEAITELMLQENVIFKCVYHSKTECSSVSREVLSSKWLHSLITMLNDTDNDVTEHARKLIMVLFI